MHIILFVAGLLVCVIFDFSILYALLAGLIIFCSYARSKGYAWGALLQMILSGIGAVKNMLVTFLLISVLTALWRASGTVAAIVSYSSRFMRPSLYLLITFLLNCGVSMLTGTALGTAATMGVICSMMARALGIDPVWVGGAVLSGAFFGDRCSPVSTSALLVAQLTHTDIFSNIPNMLRTAAIPFVISCAIYALAGMRMDISGQAIDIAALFSREFVISWAALLPALAILLLSLFRINVRITMSASILAAILVSLFLQRTDPDLLLQAAIRGYAASDSEVAAILDGGGILSMLKVVAIVCLSSSYSGIFRTTGLLDDMKLGILGLSRRITPFGATLCTATVSAVIACNQTLAIMLTNQLCTDINQDKPSFANDLEDTAVVIAPLVPWSIASAVPLAAVGAPALSILAACFLYLLPLWRLLMAGLKHAQEARPA